MKDRIEDINLSIRKISSKASKKEDVVRFDIGQPSFDTPEHVKEAAAESTREFQGYSPMMGIDSMRSLIAQEESEKTGLSPQKDEVMVTAGGMGAIFSVFSARLSASDQAVFNDPCWGPYKMISEVNGNNWRQVSYWNSSGELRDEARDAIEDAEMVVVNTPGNPTGRVLSERQAQEIAEAASDSDTFLLSDEVYHRLVFDGMHYSPAAYTDDSAVIGSVSKNHAMTGWRLGWVVDDPENLEQYAKVSRSTVACPPRISQYAAEEALKNDKHVAKMREEYEERRDILVEYLDDLGWDYRIPEGAIYAFPDVGRDSWEFCMEMIDHGVAMVPGEPMGPESDTHVRICFGSTTKDELRKGMERVQEFCS